MNSELEQLVTCVAQIIYDKKGVNIIALDLSSVSTITDAVIIAEGSIDRHVIAIAKTIIETLKKKGRSPVHVEGLKNGDWVVLDYVDFMIHLFMPGLRDLYQLEKLWSAGELIDLKIKVDADSFSNSGFSSGYENR